jgi:hypothetical protein
VAVLPSGSNTAAIPVHSATKPISFYIQMMFSFKTQKNTETPASVIFSIY